MTIVSYSILLNIRIDNVVSHNAHNMSNLLANIIESHNADLSLYAYIIVILPHVFSTPVKKDVVVLSRILQHEKVKMTLWQTLKNVQNSIKRQAQGMLRWYN